MARFLFAATAFAGHVNPALPLVRALTAAGHRVRFVTGAAFETSVTRAGAEFAAWPAEADFNESNLDATYPERAARNGIKKLQWDIAHVFVAPAATQAERMQKLLAEEPADLIVADTTCHGAAMAAELTGLPLAYFSMTAVPFASVDTAPFGLGLPPMTGPLGRLRNRILNTVVRRAVFGFSVALIDAQRARLSLPAAGRTAMEIAATPRLYLQLSPRGFDYPRSDLPSFVHFVGHPRPPQPPADWPRPDWWDELTRTDRKVVVVTQGTVATDLGELVRPTLEALGEEDVLVVALNPTGDLGPVPANVRTAAYIPFGALFPHASVVVTNGGFGGVQTAINFGVPLVVAGKTEDKAEITARVAWSGVGVNLGTQRPTPRAIRDGVRRVLSDPAFAAGAQRLRGETGAADPAERAADLLVTAAAH